MLREALDNIIEIVWERIVKAEAQGRTVTLKLRTADFATLTRARSLPTFVADRAEFTRLGHALPQPVRLMGITLSALDGEKDAPSEHSQDGQLSLL